MSFQDELKQSMRPPEVVQKEKEAREWKLALFEAGNALTEIKKGLVEYVKNAKYTIVNGVAKVNYIYELSNYDHYLTMRKEIDYKKKIIWYFYDINPKYIEEFKLFVAALEHVAEKDGIEIECFIKGINDDHLYPIPAKTSIARVYRLCICATTDITL